ncbi:MAG: hypothetical protein U9P49_11135 [Thermodesulfobacteriota bacterium]|nr:hypothetical protein [Thermodesulfobacteriota bacterium]
MSSNEIKKFKQEDMELIFKDDYSVLSGKASTGNIGYLSFHIKEIEKAVKDKIKIRKPFVYLQNIFGHWRHPGLDHHA